MIKEIDRFSYTGVVKVENIIIIFCFIHPTESSPQFSGIKIHAVEGFNMSHLPKISISLHRWARTRKYELVFTLYALQVFLKVRVVAIFNMT